MKNIESDVPWWTKKEPNFARLQAAVCRREVIMGTTEEVKKMEVESEVS